MRVSQRAAERNGLLTPPLPATICCVPSFQWRGNNGPSPQKHMWDGHGFAKSAIEFTAMAWAAEQSGVVESSRLHLYALSIELAFKSLALRAGATPAECRKAGHRISEMVRVVEKHGVVVPNALSRQLNDDDWFSRMVGSRYPVHIINPTIKETLFYHSNYPEIVAGILEIPCPCPLTFKGNGALEEIRMLRERITSSAADSRSRQTEP